MDYIKPITVTIGERENSVTLKPHAPVGLYESLISIWRDHCGGPTSLLFKADAGWLEVRESEDGGEAFLLLHPGDYFLQCVADPLGWWEDALVLHRVAYSEPMASEEAEFLFRRAALLVRNP